jgi:DNA transformation protein and related proteins
MPCSTSFVDHALDLLAGLGPVQARRMFGGYGVFLRGVMFGLLDDDELFLKTDDQSRERFTAAGCRRWSWNGEVETGYFRPPDEAHEDAEAMLPWGRMGVEAALRKKASRDAKAAAKVAGRAKVPGGRTGKAKTATKVKAKPRKPARGVRSPRPR